MTDLRYRLYCLAHYAAKRTLGRQKLSARLRSIVGAPGAGDCADTSTDEALWQSFIERSAIPARVRPGATHYAGRVRESGEWVLPSWIWTNAALVRYWCGSGSVDRAERLAASLSALQQPCGGWVVRCDYDERGEKPMLAPNDSAYIANNAFLSLYRATGKENYLCAARRCARWIMDTARPDAMIYTGYSTRDKVWSKDSIIVDVGFTAALFAGLVEATGEAAYRDFLQRFCDTYIRLFFVEAENAFATSIDRRDRPQGGLFSRGQAWAMEGLVPAYDVLRSARIKEVLDRVTCRLLASQLPDGGWAYNLSKPLLGEDCKGVSVIAKSLATWHDTRSHKRTATACARALDWCRRHTEATGDGAGGIYSFCAEGAVVRDLYTSCAFVYASAYALELKAMMRDNGNE